MSGRDEILAALGFAKFAGEPEGAERLLSAYEQEVRADMAEKIATSLEARCACYARTHPGHAHDCAITTLAAARFIRDHQDNPTPSGEE
jgi:hypothetical protein